MRGLTAILVVAASALACVAAHQQTLSPADATSAAQAEVSEDDVLAAEHRQIIEHSRATRSTDALVAEEEAYDEDLNRARDVLFIETLLQETGASLHDGAQHEGESAGADGATAFMEISTQVESEAELEKVHGYCEICIRMMQMYQRGLPDICSGLTDTFFITVRDWEH
jgi:hypothetical protein